MRMKSYFADSVELAMEKARLELGTDAMLISSHETSRDLKDLGAYEVVFGLPKPESPSAIPVPAVSSLPAAYRSASDDTVLRELAELRRQLEQLGQSVSRSSVSRAAERFTPELSRHFDRLLNVGISVEFAQELVEAAAKRTHPSGAGEVYAMSPNSRDPFARDLFEAVLREEIECRFSVAASLDDADTPSSATVFVGAPGAGKTASLVKLGLEYGIKARRPLHLWSLDTLRVAGCDQLAKYARLSGAEFRPFTEASAVAAALARCTPDDLVLIDTPGFSAGETAELEELALALRALPLAVQFVLPASLAFEPAQKIARRFAPFHPTRLLLTHMDEANSPAAAVELSARLALPLSFFGTGQQIPEDLVAVDKASLLQIFSVNERAARVGAA